MIEETGLTASTPALLWQSAEAMQQFIALLPMLLVFVIFYFLVFMPMQRQKRAQQKMLTELKAGQIVVTTGGIVGTILKIDEDDTLILRVRPDNLKLQFARSAVASLVTDEPRKT